MESARHLAGGLVALAVATVLAACGAPGVPVPPSLELPKAVTDLRAMRKGDKVQLSWTVPTKTTDSQTIRHLGPTLICRSLQGAMGQCGVPARELSKSQLATAPVVREKNGKASRGVQATFTDVLPFDLEKQNPTALVTYAIETLNDDKRSAGLSNQVQVSAAPTLPPPDDLKAQVTAEGVLLTWTGILHEHEAPELSHLYRIYRRQIEFNNDTVAGEVTLSTSPQAAFVDHSIEWEKTYYYHVAVVTTVTATGQQPVQVEGDDSPTVKVFADDIFPPAVPGGLQAVFSGVGQQPFIDLTWAPDTDEDLAGYNVYRHEEGRAPTKINPELLKTLSFRDNNVEGGKKYFYSVSAVDLRGNESGKSEEASEQVP